MAEPVADKDKKIKGAGGSQDPPPETPPKMTDTTFTIDWSENEELKDNPLVKQLLASNARQEKLIEDMNTRELTKEFEKTRAELLDAIKTLDPKQYELDKEEPDLGLLKKSLSILQRQEKENDQPPPFAGTAPSGHTHVPSHRDLRSGKYICQGCRESFEL